MLVDFLKLICSALFIGGMRRHAGAAGLLWRALVTGFGDWMESVGLAVGCLVFLRQRMSVMHNLVW